VKIEMLPGTTEGKVTLAVNKGLNMISLPLKPETPYTASSLAEKLGATTVIKLDELGQRFVGKTIPIPSTLKPGFHSSCPKARM